MAKAKNKTNSLRWVPFDVASGRLKEYLYSTYSMRNLNLDDPMVRADQLTQQYYPTDWKLNHQFADTLTFVGFVSKRARFKDSKGNEYGMFMTEFERLLLDGRLTGTSLVGNWTFAKRGSNYGIAEA